MVQTPKSTWLKVGKRQQSIVHIEQEVLKETVGSQDQVCAAFGRGNPIRFLENGGFEVLPLHLPESRLKELQSHLMLFTQGLSGRHRTSPRLM